MNIIIQCGMPTPKAIEFRSKLGINQHDIILTKEQSVIPKIIKRFSNEKALPQHSVLSYKIVFPEHKLVIEVDEKEHTDRDEKNEIERQMQ